MLPHRLPPGHHMNIRHMTLFHQKCRQDFYPSSNVKRFTVPNEKIPWTVEYPEYKPVVYTAAALKNKSWADPEINEPTFKPKWNAMDGNYSFSIPLIDKLKIKKLTMEK